MVPVVVVAVIIVVPVTLIVFPAAVVVVIVRMGPIRAGIRRSAPYSGNPHIPSPVPVPIPVDPGVTRTRDSRPDLITQTAAEQRRYRHQLRQRPAAVSAEAKIALAIHFVFIRSLRYYTFHTMRTRPQARGFGLDLAVICSLAGNPLVNVPMATHPLHALGFEPLTSLAGRSGF